SLTDSGEQFFVDALPLCRGLDHVCQNTESGNVMLFTKNPDQSTCIRYRCRLVTNNDNNFVRRPGKTDYAVGNPGRRIDDQGIHAFTDFAESMNQARMLGR